MARMLLTTITRGGSFLILQDVMGWATGFFNPFLGEGQQKKHFCLNRFCRPLPPPLYLMTSPLQNLLYCQMSIITHLFGTFVVKLIPNIASVVQIGKIKTSATKIFKTFYSLNPIFMNEIFQRDPSITRNLCSKHWKKFLISTFYPGM